MDAVIYKGKAEPSVTQLCDLCLTGGFRSPFAQAVFTTEHIRSRYEVSCRICQRQVRRRHRNGSFHNKREIPCCFKMSTSYAHELFLKIIAPCFFLWRRRKLFHMVAPEKADFLISYMLVSSEQKQRSLRDNFFFP